MSSEENPNLRTKINHSGNAPIENREFPVNEFDNTSLQEAVDQKLITTPATTEAVHDWSPSQKLETNEKKVSLKNKMIAAIAAFALLGGGVAISIGASNSQSPPVAEAPADPTEAPVEEAPVTPETPVSPETDAPLTVEDLQINAELLSDPEALNTIFVNERITAWYHEGATPENAQAANDSSDSLMEYAAKIAAESDQVFIDALLADDWESNPVLVSWVDGMKEAHIQSLALYFATSFPEITPENIEPYRDEVFNISLESSTVNPDGSVRIVGIDSSTDNRDKNIIGENPNYQITVGDKFAVSRTFAIVDGTVKLVNIVPGVQVQ